MKKILLYLLLITMNSCAYIWPQDENKEKESDEPKVEETETPAQITETDKPAAAKTTMDEIEFKQAQLWARIDELESMVRKQKEKLKLLEQGLMLGVVPKELQDSINKLEHEDTVKKVETEGMKPKETNVVKDSEKNSKYREAIEEAKLLFQSGRYGKAHLAFSKIEKDFEGAVTDGEELYWLGRCWEKLKEYQSSKKHFEDYLNAYPNSPFAVSAKFYLGKVELELGLKELAIKRFQEIIREHPYEGTAEAARQVLGNIQNSL